MVPLHDGVFCFRVLFNEITNIVCLFSLTRFICLAFGLMFVVFIRHKDNGNRDGSDDCILIVRA